VARSSHDGSLYLPDGSGVIPLSSTLSSLLERCHPQVVVDFTSAQGAMAAARAAAPQGVHLVVGSTGLEEAQLREIEELCGRHRVAAVVAPNFALGAVLLIHLSRQVARFFPYADIVETHHEAKKDAPSGTALAIARALTQGREGPFLHPMPEKEPLQGTRGGEYGGISIHSARMPGRLAHHELVLGAQGQTLTLRHDTINRECYMPGVMAAVQYVVQSKGVTVGLERILGLE
jgi:4-hydroxy-tetrahydrodipicolinate reductase